MVGLSASSWYLFLSTCDCYLPFRVTCNPLLTLLKVLPDHLHIISISFSWNPTCAENRWLSANLLAKTFLCRRQSCRWGRVKSTLSGLIFLPPELVPQDLQFCCPCHNTVIFMAGVLQSYIIIQSYSWQEYYSTTYQQHAMITWIWRGRDKGLSIEKVWGCTSCYGFSHYGLQGTSWCPCAWARWNM